MRRRHFIRGAAGAIAAAGLPLPAMEALRSSAGAQSQAPKRFVAVMGALGIKLRRWITGTPDNYAFGPGIQILEPYRNDITVFRGLQPKRANHGGSSACFLTGDNLSNDAAKHASIDQRIAALNEPSAAAASGDIVRSIQCGVGVRGTGGRATMVWEAAGSPLHPKNDPSALFDALFTGAATTDGSVDAVAARVAAEQSIFDAHVAELGALKAVGSSEDRLRLEQHLDGIRTLEGDLQRLKDGTIQTGECTNPQRYEPGSTIGAAPYDQIAKAHCDIIGRAFACDITRVATLQLFYDGGGGIGLDFLEGRHAGISGKSVHDTKHDEGTASDVVDDWYAEVVKYLLDQLSAPDPLDPNGGRLLDNTVLLFGSNLHNPAHGAGPNYGWYGGKDGSRLPEQDTTDTAYLIAGSAGGHLNTGQYFDHRVPGLHYGENSSKYSAGDGHVYHNRLLVSLVNAFGVETSTVGDSSYSAGGALDEGLIR